MDPQERQVVIGIVLALIVAIGIWTVGFVLRKKRRIRWKTYIRVVVPLGGLCLGIPPAFLETADEPPMCRLSAIILCVIAALLGPYFMVHYLRLVMGVDIRRYYDDDEEPQ